MKAVTLTVYIYYYLPKLRMDIAACLLRLIGQVIIRQ